MPDPQERIDLLQAEISELPKGYISRKTINGTVRQYHQWMENGKKKSKYLDDETAAIMAERIARRKELQQKLKIMKSQLPIRQEKKSVLPEFRANVLTGEVLNSFIQSISGLKSRPCLKQLVTYLSSENRSRVFILYGLRRTGKTTMIQQAVAGLSPGQFAKTAFIQISNGNTLADINSDLKMLLKEGFEYVFLDEVTLLEDFIEGAALFSDVYASCGMKIVLSGTDSLGFLFSADDQLYDRCELLHTTFISYSEFESVLGVKGIDEYIRYGGTMSLGGIHYNTGSTFSSGKSTDEYIDSAIAGNIQHSLRNYQNAGHFRHLQDLYEHDELTSAINRVVEDINHRFTIDVLIRDFVSHDLGLSARNLRSDRDNPTDILDHIDKKTFTDSLKKALAILNRAEQKVEINDAHRTEIKEYLDLLDLTEDIPVETIPAESCRTYRTVISQPGLRYAQAETLIRELMKDSSFQNISAHDRKRITDRILDEIRGRMMEEIILLETKKAMPGKDVFTLKFAVGEFDMVICDPDNVTCEIFEIKHSTEAVPHQYRHLKDEQKCSATEFRYGTIIRKAVIYRGNTMQSDGIEYINAEEYLKGLSPMIS
ncbi:MAG: AAA family ATPase [Bullifex sp.]